MVLCFSINADIRVCFSFSFSEIVPESLIFRSKVVYLKFVDGLAVIVLVYRVLIFNQHLWLLLNWKVFAVIYELLKKFLRLAFYGLIKVLVVLKPLKRARRLAVDLLD
jgi:hypothetical protein